MWRKWFILTDFHLNQVDSDNDSNIPPKYTPESLISTGNRGFYQWPNVSHLVLLTNDGGQRLYTPNDIIRSCILVPKTTH